MKKRDIPCWHEYFLDMTDLIKGRSKDRSVQVGCVIVGEGNIVLSSGYNGFPRNVKDKEERHERPLKYKITEHSERNAIYNAARHGIRLLDSTIYVKVWPCTDCARAIIQSGIKRIIIDGRGYIDRINIWCDRWEEEFNIALEMLFESRIDCLIWVPNQKIINLVSVNHCNWKDISINY